MFKSVDEYISSFPEDTQTILQKIRQTLREVVPGGEEVMSYGIPTLKLRGKAVVYFSGWKDHVSIHPAPRAMPKEVAPYQTGKGTLQFVLSKPIPYLLIKEVAVVLLKEHAARTGYSHG